MKKVFNIRNLILLVIGIILGLISKLLDGTSILDLGNLLSSLEIWILFSIIITKYSKDSLSASINVFIFLFSMCLSYHLSSIFIAGFNPFNYMLRWYFISIISIFFAYILYRFRENIIIHIIIYTIMYLLCFGIGFIYFDIISIPKLLIFIITVIILNKDYKKTIISLIISLLLAYLLRLVV